MQALVTQASELDDRAQELRRQVAVDEERVARLRTSNVSHVF